MDFCDYGLPDFDITQKNEISNKKKAPELGERGCQYLRGHLRERFMKVTSIFMPQCGRPVKDFFT
jgi:hypothetical protein